MEDLLYQISRLIIKLQSRHVISCKERQIGQKTEESLETDPQIYGYLIYDKGDRAGQWKMNNLFNNWCWVNQGQTDYKPKWER